MARLSRRFGVRVLALALLAVGAGGGYRLGHGRQAEERGVTAQLAAEAGRQEIEYLTQIKWGLGYIKSRYGDPCGAWAHSEEVGSY